MGFSSHINSAPYQLRALLMVVQDNKSESVPSSVQMKHYTKDQLQAIHSTCPTEKQWQYCTNKYIFAYYFNYDQSIDLRVSKVASSS